MVTFIQRIFLKPGMVSHFQHTRDQKAFVSLNEATSVGILADLRVSGNLPVVVHFARSVHKPSRRCHILLIIPDKRKELNPLNYEKQFPGMPVELVCQDEMNIFKVPRKDLTHHFTVNKYDIVFYLETGSNFSLESIFYHTHSKMYAGVSGLCSGYFDFEIDLADRPEMSHLTENLLKYLQKVPEKQESNIPESDKFTLF